MRKNKHNPKAVAVIIAAVSAALLIVLIVVLFALKDRNAAYGFAREIPEEEQILRLKLVETAQNWLGSNEEDGSHKSIIDIYNRHEPLAEGYRVKYDDQWCATFVSAAAIEAGLTDIIPTECGCQRQIGLFQELGVWEEADDYLPLPGDIIYYCRSNAAMETDCTGWADHVGIVVGTNGNRIKVIEGNYADRVDYRYLQRDAHIIRGYALPDYSRERP